MQALASISALPAVAASAQTAASGESDKAETAELAPALHDETAHGVTKFFEAPHVATLTKLCGLLMPSFEGAPGALDTGTVEFLDFYIGKSPVDRQQVYLVGLDALEHAALDQFGKSFVDISDSQADKILAPLFEREWTRVTPEDALERFLKAIRTDVRQATVNTYAYLNKTAEQAGRGRRRRGTGLYWYRID